MHGVIISITEKLQLCVIDCHSNDRLGRGREPLGILNNRVVQLFAYTKKGGGQISLAKLDPPSRSPSNVPA